MGKYERENPNDLLQIIARMEKRIRVLETGMGIGATSVDTGELRIPNGRLIIGEDSNVYFGPVVVGGDTVTGWVFRRADGTIVFELVGNDENDTYFLMRDSSENIILAEDNLTNQGLARPYISVSFQEHHGKVAAISTTSATFEGTHWTRYTKQHPQLQVRVLATSGAATTGEWQVWNNSTGTPIAGPFTIAAGFAGVQELVGPVIGDHMSEHEIEIQARRTGGVNAIGIFFAGAYGIQS
jgi:hypothetical protein